MTYWMKHHSLLETLWNTLELPLSHGKTGYLGKQQITFFWGWQRGRDINSEYLCTFPYSICTIRSKWDHHPHLWMDLKEHEPGTTPRLHVAFCDSGRGLALTLWTPRRLHKQRPAWRGHIAIYVRSHRTTISSQCKIHRWRHGTRQFLGGILVADQASREPPQCPAQHNALHPHNTRPICSLPPTPPGTRPLGRHQGRVRRHAAGRHHQTRRGPVVARPPSRAEGPVETIEPLTLGPSRTGIQSHTYRTTPTAFPAAPPFRRLNW